MYISQEKRETQRRDDQDPYEIYRNSSIITRPEKGLERHRWDFGSPGIQNYEFDESEDVGVLEKKVFRFKVFLEVFG